MRLGHIGQTSYSMRFDVVHRENGNTYARGQLNFVFIDDQFPPNPVPVPDGMRKEMRSRGYDV